MQRVSVTSSNIASIGYDGTSLTLEIEFTDGHVYQYFDVPEHVHVGLMQASSHGQFLNTAIKGRYRYARIS